jgi:hypothetical protein
VARRWRIVVTWGVPLLEQGEELAYGLAGKFGSAAGTRRGGEVGGGQRNAEVDMVAVDHEDVATALKGSADRVDGEATAVERMGGIGYFHPCRLGKTGMADWGIELMFCSRDRIAAFTWSPFSTITAGS